MKNMLTRTILLVLLVAILPSCEREHLSCYSEQEMLESQTVD